jgi:hypothetical protein
MPLAYDPTNAALYTPGLRPTVLQPGPLPALNALCAELSRLVYIPFEKDSAHASRLAEALGRVGIGAPTPLCSSATGTQAFAAVLPDGRSLVVFRGTEPQAVSDIGTDLAATLDPWQGHATARVHHGFAKALASIEAELARWLAGRPGAPVIFTGHSLGAALATLAASRWQAAQLITFGSPRVGNADFVATLAATAIERYVDCCDIVTHLPPECPFYTAAGATRYIDADGFYPARAADPVTDQLKARVAYLTDHAWRLGNLIARDLADHAPINYVRAFFS